MVPHETAFAKQDGLFFRNQESVATTRVKKIDFNSYLGNLPNKYKYSASLALQDAFCWKKYFFVL